jgi:hypothetical protein
MNIIRMIKKFILPILLILGACQIKQAETNTEAVKNSPKDSGVTAVDKVAPLLEEDEGVDPLFDSKEFKIIGLANGIDMLHVNKDTLEIVGPLNGAAPKAGFTTLSEFLSNIFETGEHDQFLKYKVIELTQDLSGDSCARYVFENNKLKEIKKCRY